MSPIPAPPRLLLNLQALAGASLATRDRVMELADRYREPESLAVTISKALDAGAEGILAGLTPRVRAAMSALRRPVPVFAMVPALAEDERGERMPALEVLLEKSRERATGGGRARAAFGLARPSLLARGDWAAQIGALMELELSGVKNADRRAVVLDPWLTDLAVASGDPRFLQRFVRMVRRRFKLAAGLDTNNVGFLLKRLVEWNLEPDFVVGAVNPSGVRMKPSLRETLEALRTCGLPVIAKDLRAGGTVALEDGAAFAREHGAHGLAPDVGEMEDVPGELRAVQGTAGKPAATAR